MRIFSSLLEALGLIAVVLGAYLCDLRAGIIVGGLVMVLVGFTVDGPRRAG